MKILMLGWELPPNNSGGLGVACYQLSKSLSEKKVDIEFILPYKVDRNYSFMKVRSARHFKTYKMLNIKSPYQSYKYLYDTNEIDQFNNVRNHQDVYIKSVSDISINTSFDIIHAHDWLTFRAALRAKENTGKPLILHVHSIESDRSGGNHGNPLVREIEETSMRIADRIIAVSQHTKDGIVNDYHIPKDKIEVIHNSIDSNSLHPISENNEYRYLEYLKSIGYKVVVNVGRLTIQKGLTNLLHAAQLVIERNPKTIFLIVGCGEQRDELIDLSVQLNIGANVIFTGFQRGKHWRDAFSIGDLFVLPSVSEPFGLTPLESIYYGTPVIISRQSGVSEVLLNCLKIDYWDVNEMANKILSVLNNNVLADELLRNSQCELSNASWSESADKVIETYIRHMEPTYA